MSRGGIRSPDGRIAFALGLLEIGKEWGCVPAPVPDEEEALEFLSAAWRLGVRHFDTAASYGASEERFGSFLGGLGEAERSEAFVATKFGEHWDTERQEPYVDHSYDGLLRSLERSVRSLGAIDLLQLHKTTPEVLRSRDLERAWEAARSAGVRETGASVSDVESAEIAMASGLYSALQFPFNRGDTRFRDVIDRATGANIRILVNRPFQMGRLLYEDGKPAPESARIAALAFILRHRFAGMVLFGTRSADHLRENIRSFAAATRKQ